METILQFGAGRFLRAFADAFIHEANHGGQNAGQIVVVQSTAGERAAALTRRNCRYHVALRGLRDGKTVDRVDEIQSISRAIVATESWDDVLEFARSPNLQTILSNTTEAGYELGTDAPDDNPPMKFPAKLLQVLKARHDAGLASLTILPCELFENNAKRLQGVVLEQAARWQWTGPFIDWIRNECRWRNSLVDRIVSGVPAEHPMLAEDPLLIAAEPYALWAIEHRADEPKDPGEFSHTAILRVPDVEPYHLRKVRILNGAHSALVCKALPLGFRIVRDAVEDPEIGTWLKTLIFEEIVPVVALSAEHAEEFAHETIERFRNPFLDHKLSDIALHHESKIKIRLVPTRDEYVRRFGKQPKLLSELLADQ